MDTKALRQKILDLAIRGKLVPQDPNDEPASVLLERIHAEKQQMVKDGKLKPKDIKNDTVIFKGDDNLHYEKFADGSVKLCDFKADYEIPNNWVWCNLGLLFNHNTGKALNSANSEGKTLTYITTSNVYWDRFELNDLKSMPFTESEIEKCTVKKGDLLVCEGGDIGRAAIWNFDNEIRIQNHLHRLRAYDDIQATFYYYVLYILKLSGKINGKGIGLQGLSSNALHNIIVPVPPVDEQKNIVISIEKFMSSIDNIENHKNILTTCIDATKAKILDLAIRGKLVPQDPNDEPASALLERIRTEKEKLIKQGKIKRNKKESVIFKGSDNSYYEKIGNNIICIDDEIPFETPINWQWVRLGSTVKIERGGSPRPIKSYITTDSNGINWIKIGDVDKDGKYITNTKEKIKPTGIKKSKEVYPGDFLLTNSMSFGRPYISKIYGCVHDGWLVLRNPDVVFDINFLYYLLSSTYLYNQFVIKASGSTVDNLNIDKVSSALICLPPLKEQTMIVNQIEKIIRLIQPFEELF